jgi:hypothetical protein
VLLVLPWSTYWDRNLFVTWFPAVEHLLQSPYARGAVSGVGVITGVAGVLELAAAFGVRGRAGPEEPRHGV